MTRFAIFLVACLSLLAGCGDSTAPVRSVHEITGSASERVAAVSAVIGHSKAPPTSILDARLVEEKIGDGVFGPSDFWTFYVIEVAPRDVPQWTRMLVPLEAIPEYAAPEQPRDWWIARDAFGALQFYKPDALTGRSNGWIGVSQSTGRIYFFTFTT